MTGPQWYVCQTKPNAEAAVVDQLKREKFETLYPTFIKRRKIKLRDIEFERPLFPGYVMVRFDFESDDWLKIGALRGVKTLLGYNGKKATPLPEMEVEDLFDRFGSGPLVIDVPSIPWNAGDKLRIAEGPFTGKIVEYSRLCLLPEGERIRALFTFLRRETVIFLAPSQVQRT